jgi:precorrin-6B methylase 2
MSISLHQTLFGSMFHLTADRCIGQSLKIYGQWALDEIALLYKILKQSERGDFIDLGANVGTHTVAIGKLLPGCEVYSFEAQEEVFRLLSANTLINGLMNTRLSNCLVGDATKLARFVSKCPSRILLNHVNRL